MFGLEYSGISILYKFKVIQIITYIAIGSEDKQNEWRLDYSVSTPRKQFISFVIHNIHKFADEWKQTIHGKVFISGNLHLVILLLADDVILFANSEDDLKHSIYQFQLIAENLA
jgi:hypothetical protein